MKSITKARTITLASTFAVVTAGSSLLQGCDGGEGSSSNPPPATTLSWSVQQTKTFHFTWTDVSGETEYRLMENPDGVSGYTQVASIAADATSYDLVVSLPKRVNAKYILQSCTGNDCADSNEVTFTSTLVDGVGYLKASNTSANSTFGKSIALSSDGNTLVVGARGEGGWSGAVYVFKKGSSGWSQDGAPIKASNAGNGDYFGTSVALSSDGTVLAVGAFGEDDATKGITPGTYTTVNDTALNSGAAYIFSNSGSGWTQTNYIKGSDTVTGDQFGMSVALSGDGTLLAVGANATAGGGKVYLFSDSGTAWGEDKILIASNAGAGDSFGSSIALSSDGGTLAVGAYLEDSNATGVSTTAMGTDQSATFNSGAVYVFTRSSNWSQQAYIKAFNTGAADEFGFSVALSGDGNTLAVGADFEESLSTGINSNPNDTPSSDAGAAYVFTRDVSAWSQQAYIKAHNTGGGDYFGASVALSDDGNTLAVGADCEESTTTGINSNPIDTMNFWAGAVYAFSRDGGTWSQQAYVKASNTGDGDYFGNSVALNSDGSVMAVGAHSEDSTSTGVNSTPNDTSTTFNAGAVYLY